MNILEEIFAHKRLELAEKHRRVPLAAVREAAESAPETRDFIASLRSARKKPALIAEVKRASPSRGVLRADFHPVELALEYQVCGAAAVSVLTETRYFQGSLEDLTGIRRALDAQAGGGLPILRKDFLFDEYQVYEAKAAGADALLLIAAYLDPGCLADLFHLAGDLGMAALIEVHNREDLEKALLLAPGLIGVNNRDLKDFSVRIETTLDLRPLIPAGVCLVSESGIKTRQDLERLAAAGVDAILVGESLVTAQDLRRVVKELLG